MLAPFIVRPSCAACVAVLMAFACGLPPSVCRASEPVDAPAGGAVIGKTQAGEAFDAVNRRFDDLSSLQYEVQRKTVSKGMTLDEQWSFVYVADGRLRIEYQKPEKRVFVFDGKVFTEYLPAVRQALKTKIDAGKPQGLSRISAVLQRLSVDGLRVGDRDVLLAHFDQANHLADQPAVLQVTGKDPASTVLIDTQRQALLRFDKYDRKGNLALSIRASDFQEPVPGFWFPTTVHTIIEGASGRSETMVAISSIRLNAAIPEKTFTMSLPPDVKVNTAE